MNCVLFSRCGQLLLRLTMKSKGLNATLLVFSFFFFLFPFSFLFSFFFFLPLYQFPLFLTPPPFLKGTEATACNPRTIASLERSGFTITKSKETTQTNNPENNPTYLVSGNITNTNPLFCFSKTIDDSFNPKKNFVSIMTCSSADAGCPVVFGAFARIPVTFEDPKVVCFYCIGRKKKKKRKERGEMRGLNSLYFFFLRPMIHPRKKKFMMKEEPKLPLKCCTFSQN